MMEKGPYMYCPFRVFRQEHPALLKGQGATTTEEFYKCMGKECAAYFEGGCLRLVPPAPFEEPPTFLDTDSPEAHEMIVKLTKSFLRDSHGK